MIKAQTIEMEHIYPHLGHSLKSLLEENKMSQRELSARTAVSSSYISSVIKGDRPISPGFACKLEQVFAISAEKIMFHQVERELKLIKEENYDLVEKDTKILSKIRPMLSLMIKSELPLDQIDEEQIVLNLRRFFKVSSLANLPALHQGKPLSACYLGPALRNTYFCC